MVRVTFNNDTGKELEDFVIRDLRDSIIRELEGLKCAKCKKDSQVRVTLRKNKLNGMRVTVNACCEEFNQEISEVLLLNHPDSPSPISSQYT